MINTRSKPLLLIGSVPLETAEEVFTQFGSPLGRYLAAMPDGEIGIRRMWISRVHFQVLAIHPDIEVLRRPQLEDGAERLSPRDAADAWHFRVRTGVTRVRFDQPGWRLGYAREAINDYFVFRTLRDKGVLPTDLRFQVSVASVSSAMPPRIFANLSDMEIVREGYEEALRAEVLKIVEKIPAGDLAIQWDCATEVHDAYGAAAPLPPEGGIERNLGQFARLCPQIPTEVEIGVHLCFGTLGGWPRFAPADLSKTVELANRIIEVAGRPVSWMHLPVLDRSDDAFFAPLAKLRPQGARIYLGVIHNMSRYAARVAMARRYCKDFGVAAFCGFGRMSPSEMPQVLADHLRAAELHSSH